MWTALDVDCINDFSITQNRDGSSIDVADVDRIVAYHDEVASAWRSPVFDKFSILIKNGDALVVAVGNEQAALRINGDSVRQLKLTGSVTLDAANDFDEFSILR